MRIACDIDGVLADFISSFRTLIFQQTGRVIPEIATHWNWHRTAGVTHKEESELWDRIRRTDFWSTLAPINDARPGVQFLYEMEEAGDADVYFITSRPGHLAKMMTEDWLTKHFDLPNPTVLIAPSDHAKGQLCKALKTDVFVDDKPNNCAEVNVACGDQCHIFLVNRPYNQDVQDVRMYLTGVQRVATLGEALEQASSSLEVAA